jgi:hypothetical protein
MSDFKHLGALNIEAKEFQKIAKLGNLSWQKKKNPMAHLTPKKKKR